MTIGNHSQYLAKIVIQSGVEGWLLIAHVSTSLNMTDAICSQMFVNRNRYSFKIN